MTVAKDVQENLKLLASAVTTISAVLNDEKLENAPARDRAQLLVHVAASLRDMAVALGRTASSWRSSQRKEETSPCEAYGSAAEKSTCIRT